MASESAVRIGILAYPDCFASEIFGVTDLITMGNQVARAHELEPPFVTSVMSPRRSVTVSGGVRVSTTPPAPVDVLVVPGFDIEAIGELDDYLARLRPETEVVATHSGQGGTVVSICVGAFLLAETGVLDNRTATTSWLYAAMLHERRPAVAVKSHELVVNDSGVTTTAAFSAMYDFVLSLLERHCGATIARRTARVALLDDARQSQTPYVDEALLPSATPSFAGQVQRYLEQQLARRYDLDRLAAHFHLSSRTLLRKYRAETGEAPLAYLQRVRVRKARHLLENSEQTLTEVQNAVGYRDAGSFNALFQRHVGIGPAAYRQRFRRARDQG